MYKRQSPYRLSVKLTENERANRVFPVKASATSSRLDLTEYSEDPGSAFQLARISNEGIEKNNAKPVSNALRNFFMHFKYGLKNRYSQLNRQLICEETRIQAKEPMKQ